MAKEKVLTAKDRRAGRNARIGRFVGGVERPDRVEGRQCQVLQQINEATTLGIFVIILVEAVVPDCDRKTGTVARKAHAAL
jgi:hypothetical protein